MLEIYNADNGAITQTNYWQSELNARGLAYLSGHHLGLRLLLPNPAAGVWLPEIKTGQRALIEPNVRMMHAGSLDVVFDDGTKNPFSITIEPTHQLDRQLRSGSTRLIIYVGSLEQTLELPCEINLPDAPAQDYLTHATVNTGHSRRSYRAEVADDVVVMLQTWLPDLMAGKSHGLWDDGYAVRLDWHNSKSAGFVVSRLDSLMSRTDIAKIAVCRHSKKAAPAWEYVGGSGQPPRVPFVAAALENRNITINDLDAIGAIADFERCLAWAWLGSH